MARVKPYSGTIIVPDSMRASELTVPGIELYHYITDDQLTELSAMRAEPVREIAMASAGTFIGSAIPALEALSRFQDSENPMGYIGLLSVMLSVVSFVLAAFSGWLWYQRHKRHESLADTIRSRPKVKVSPANDADGVQSGEPRPLPAR